jgi:hypothetical protein
MDRHIQVSTTDTDTDMAMGHNTFLSTATRTVVIHPFHRMPGHSFRMAINLHPTVMGAVMVGLGHVQMDMGTVPADTIMVTEILTTTDIVNRLSSRRVVGLTLC